jgi:predicted NUDIX family NTP pyrophosphohydrolase
MPVSAGILLYRHTLGFPQVLLVHLGGPFFAKKDEGAWTIPKGMVNPGEDLLTAALREFNEETGFIASGQYRQLTRIKLRGGKEINIWAVEGDADLADFKSNTFELEWPPQSGRITQVPEADRAEWFTIDEAKNKIVNGQLPILNEFETII